MNPEQQPPGAWYLGGANAASAPGAGFNPQPPLVGLNPQPPLVGLNPQPPLVGWNPQPPLVGWNPQPPYAGWNPQPPTSSQALLVGGPWVGLDPAWVYAGGEQALHAQALSRVRSRIVAPEDPRSPPAAKGRLRAAAQSQPLWRWARPFRLSAAQAELQGRLVVQGFQVWWVPAPQALPPLGLQTPSLLFTLNPPNAPRAKGVKGKAPPPFNYDLQIDKVLRAAVEREERMPEILAQANDIGSFFDALIGIDRGNAPHLAELMDLVWEVSAQLLMALKHNVAEWRPMQRSARVVPVIVTPGHGSLPSGHATTSVMTSELLSTLLKYPAKAERRAQLDALARRIAFNRVVAGVHFPMDSAAGHALGRQIAAALAAAATGAALPAPVTFDVRPDSELKEAAGPMAAARAVAPPAKTAPTAGDTPLFALMWRAASREVAGRRI